MKTIPKKTLLLGITVILLFSGTTVVAEDCNLEISLPSDYITMVAVDGENSWFDIILSDIPTGYDIVDGTYLGWCAQYSIKMSRGVNHAVTLYSSYDPDMPESFQDTDWDKANYILNHKQNYSYSSIQKALWYFIDDQSYPSDAEAQALISDANASGSGYCPGSGDILAILVEVHTIVQQTFLELTIPETSTGGENPGSGLSNHPPTADAYFGEPYEGVVDEEITFDGAHSYDRDGSIVSWHWDFGDLTFGDGEIMTHIYVAAETYDVSLTVTDDDGATDTYETVATIAIGNEPPTAPVVNGSRIGTKNTDYLYTAVSTDPENDTMRYVFDWDDGANKTETNLTESETSVNATHTWTAAGVYRVNIYAQDEHNKTSDTTEILVLIDVNVEFIDGDISGYLIDYEKTGISEVFYNNATGVEIAIEEQDDGTYLIDVDGDGEWDYTYDLMTGLAALQEDEDDERQTPGFEFILAICAISLILLLRRRKK